MSINAQAEDIEKPSRWRPHIQWPWVSAADVHRYERIGHLETIQIMRPDTTAVGFCADGNHYSIVGYWETLQTMGPDAKAVGFGSGCQSLQNHMLLRNLSDDGPRYNGHGFWWWMSFVTKSYGIEKPARWRAQIQRLWVWAADVNRYKSIWY